MVNPQLGRGREIWSLDNFYALSTPIRVHFKLLSDTADQRVGMICVYNWLSRASKSCLQ